MTRPNEASYYETLPLGSDPKLRRRLLIWHPEASEPTTV